MQTPEERRAKKAACGAAHYQANKAEILARAAVYYKAHKDESAAYREKNKDRIAARQKAYRKANKAEIAARKAAWREKNKDKNAAYKKAYYEAHKADIQARKVAYREAHKAELAAREAAWAKANPDKCRDMSARRRARKLGATVEPVSRAEVFERDRGICHLCGKKVDPKNWHLDHIVPLSQGGEHSYRNVAVSHPFCNLSKHAKTRGQFRLF